MTVDRQAEVRARTHRHGLRIGGDPELAVPGVVAGGVVAHALGPQLTGLLATFPLYGAILAGFAHHLQGPGPAIRVLRGLLLGLFAFAGFFFVLAMLLERVGIAGGFAAAIAAVLALQGGALWALRRALRRA